MQWARTRVLIKSMTFTSVEDVVEKSSKSRFYLVGSDFVEELTVAHKPDCISLPLNKCAGL